MDPLLFDLTDFTPYYPSDNLEEVLPLAEDALAWLDNLSLPVLQHSSEDSVSPEASSAFTSTSLELSGPSTSPSDSRSAPSSSRSPEDHPGRGDGYTSSSSSTSTSEEEEECPRRVKKSRISLDPCQPLTVKGKPRARVYVACRECRNRKVRCDGAKPVCFNCTKREPNLDKCDYDPAPNRRGQDKVPGSRTRSAVGQRAPRHSHSSSDRPEANGHHLKNGHSSGMDFEAIIQGFDPATFDPRDVASYQLPAPPAADTVEDEEETSNGETHVDLFTVPNMQFARETWWDALLAFYACPETDGEFGDVALTAEQRTTTTKRVFADIRAILRTSVYWASFLHLPRFFETLLDPTRRNSVQPSLLLGMLAIGAHVESSELKQGAKGRARAQKLIDRAHSALQASLSANWLDVGLVQAAWFMAYFEMQGHSHQSWDRCRSSITLLDSLIQLFSLTTVDADRPEAHYAIFGTSARTVVGGTGQPMFHDAIHGAACPNTGGGVHASSDPHVQLGAEPDMNRLGKDIADVAGLAIPVPAPDPASGAAAQCACTKFTLKEQWPTVSEIAPDWEATTMWPDGLSEGEVRKEECRRLVWSSVMLSAGQNSYTSADAEVDRADLFIKDYRNYAVLFPGEDLCRSGNMLVRQNNVWNLCLRTMVLWNTSVRQRSNPMFGLQERADYARSAWLEADAIEAALDQHTCGLEGSVLFQTREFLFTTRMCISHEFRLYAPQVTTLGIMSYYRGKAEAWLRRQMWVSQTLWKKTQDSRCDIDTRPLLSYWFMGHIVRALILYKTDPTLLLALEAAKVHVKPLEYLMRIWPCDEQRQKWSVLRRELVQACLKAGVAPPEAAVPAPFVGVAKKSPTSVGPLQVPSS